MTFRTYASVLSHFGQSDYSIPLTLLYKMLAQTVGLTEMATRAPMLICGVGAIVALPLLTREYVGRPAAHTFAWLLAIAPFHVYFSRYARRSPVGLGLRRGRGRGPLLPPRGAARRSLADPVRSRGPRSAAPA
jgi:hypothetical protein